VQEDVDDEQVKKAYRKKSLQWHPDKHPEEQRETATAEFQKIGAAFAKLQDNDADSDGYEYDSDDGDYYDFFDLFAYMHHMGGQGYGSFGGGGGYGGGSRGFPGGPSNRSSKKSHYDFADLFNGRRWRRSRRRHGKEEDHDEEYYKKYWEEREKADDLAEKVKLKAEQDRAARQASENRARWLEKLGRLTRLSFTDNSIKLSADTKGTRTSHFKGYKIPENFYWELQLDQRLLL
jgi:curved DNA-binding protein CbpA